MDRVVKEGLEAHSIRRLQRVSADGTGAPEWRALKELACSSDRAQEPSRPDSSVEYTAMIGLPIRLTIYDRLRYK